LGYTWVVFPQMTDPPRASLPPLAPSTSHQPSVDTIKKNLPTEQAGEGFSTFAILQLMHMLLGRDVVRPEPRRLFTKPPQLCCGLVTRGPVVT